MHYCAHSGHNSIFALVVFTSQMNSTKMRKQVHNPEWSPSGGTPYAGWGYRTVGHRVFQPGKQTLIVESGLGLRLDALSLCGSPD